MARHKGRYKIELLKGDNIIHTIEKDAMNIKVKHVLTTNVGTFQFGVPVRYGRHYKFWDVTPFDKAKIYLGYDPITDADLEMVGRIYRISGTYSKDTGFQRMFYGRDQGEILQRRFKSEYDWDSIGASTIAEDLADDLSLGTTEIEADASAETFRIDYDKHERYFDMFRKVSDYWVSAGVQVKKDFKVDCDFKLVWKSRPFRVTAEDLVVGRDIIAYQLIRDLTPVKNKIWVYGQRLKKYDNDADLGTELGTPPWLHGEVDQNSASGQKILYLDDTTDFSASDDVLIFDGTNWEEGTVDSVTAGDHITLEDNLTYSYTAGSAWCIVIPGWGTATADTQVAQEAVKVRVGSVSVEIQGLNGGGWVGAFYHPAKGVRFNLNRYPNIGFHFLTETDVSGWACFWDEDRNYAYRYFNEIKNDGLWHPIELQCGRDHEDGWVIDASFDWSVVEAIEIAANTGTLVYYVDGMYLNGRPFNSCEEDSTSQTDYGIREMMVMDDSLTSDALCECRGQALLYALKDIPKRLDIAMLGNKRIKVGDRKPFTIPAEHLTSENFDVVEVIQTFTKEVGFRTAAVMVDSAEVRDFPAVTVEDVMVTQFSKARAVAKGIRQINAPPWI